MVAGHLRDDEGRAPGTEHERSDFYIARHSIFLTQVSRAEASGG
jgi:hypothetical protein